MSEMIHHPTFSVVIPVHNREKLIRRSVESVLAQDIDDFEVLCIENGSTDRTWQVLTQLAEEDERVRIYHLEQGDRCIARNHGMNEALGLWVCFLDSDDTYHPDHLSSFLTQMEKHPGHKAYASSFAHTGKLTQRNQHLRLNNVSMDLSFFIRANPFQVGQLCLDSEFFLETRFYEGGDLPIAEDWLFVREVAKRSPIFKFHRETLTIHEHEDRTMRQSDPSEVAACDLRSTELFIARNRPATSIAQQMMAHVQLLASNMLLHHGQRSQAWKHMKRAMRYSSNWYKPGFYFGLLKFLKPGR